MRGKLDIFSYTNTCEREQNSDVMLSEFWDDQFHAVLCDGFNGDTETAVLCSETAFKMMRDTDDIGEILKYIYQSQEISGFSTICIFRIKEGLCQWGNIGDSRMYHFSDGMIADKSIDSSEAYRHYIEGTIRYEDIRMSSIRSKLTAYLGDSSKTNDIYTDEFKIKNGDTFLICSDGFWQYVYECEMEIDLCKSCTSHEWAENMLLRLAVRSVLAGDSAAVTAVIYQSDKGEEENNEL